MNLKPRKNARAKLISSLGIGLLALSTSGLVMAQGASPAAKKGTPSAAAKAPGLAAQPAKRPAHAIAGGSKSGKKSKSNKGGSQAEKKNALTVGSPSDKTKKVKKAIKTSRKQLEAAASDKVKRSVAIHRYKAAKLAMHEADAALQEGSEVDPIAARAARKAAQSEVKYARRHLQKAHSNRAKQFQSQNKSALKQYRKQLRVLEANLRKDRKARAEAARAALTKKYGRKLQLQTVRAELQQHAWRVARLNRLIEIAEVTEQPEAAKRAGEILAAENKSHIKRLFKLSLAPLPKPKPEAARSNKKPPPIMMGAHGVTSQPSKPSSAKKAAPRIQRAAPSHGSVQPKGTAK